MIPAPFRRAAVLGKPIAHSLSPALHRAAYRVLGLQWEYTAVEMDEAGLAEFVLSRDESWAGLSLTMPLKRAVRPLLDEISPVAAEVGAVNTVVFRDGRRCGDNTDVPGMVEVFRESGVVAPGMVGLLGAGATATSALAALREISPGRTVAAARRPEAGAELVAAGSRLGLTIEMVPWARAGELFDADLLVSTVPAGAADSLVDDVAECGGTGLLFDVVYAPWPTPLAAAWSRRGGVVGGLELLVHQAALQVAIMHGGDVDASSLVPAMRAAGEAALR